MLIGFQTRFYGMRTGFGIEKWPVTVQGCTWSKESASIPDSIG
jgi:hypothetical protein